jgi:hypothetical protein
LEKESIVEVKIYKSLKLKRKIFVDEENHLDWTPPHSYRDQGVLLHHIKFDVLIGSSFIGIFDCCPGFFNPPGRAMSPPLLVHPVSNVTKGRKNKLRKMSKPFR